MRHIHESAQFTEELEGQRLDKALSVVWSQYSRAKLTQWLKQGAILVDGQAMNPKIKVKGCEQVVLDVDVVEDESLEPQKMDLDIVFEDDDVLVVNKPTHCVVHPAAGNESNTLLNGLIYHCPLLKALPRAGIVHRLDKDTTGLMVVAKSLEAHHKLVDALQRRDVHRKYQALVQGQLVCGKTVHTMMNRHPRNRLKMAVADDGKEAITHFTVKEKFSTYSLLDVKLETGRTHQIRVHMSHIGHPIVGDTLYGAKPKFPKRSSDALKQALEHTKSQLLHAYQLGFAHPITGEYVEFDAPIPESFEQVLAHLRKEDAL